MSQPRRRFLGLSRGVLIVAAVVVVAVAALGAIFVRSNANGSAGGGVGKYAYKVGQPGPGAQAPEIDLPSTAGGTFDLQAMRGKTVLLYFQEGLTCEPCWTQLKDIQAQQSRFQALGIDQIVSITSDPLSAIKQKVSDEGITIPVLSDENLQVSKLYNADKFTMMPAMMGMAARDGHSFVMVNKDGTIAWRADYGGAPNYTMYVPVPTLLAQIQQGMSGAPR